MFWQEVEVELEMGPTYMKPKAFHPAFVDPCMRACCPAHESVTSIYIYMCVCVCLYLSVSTM